MPAPRPRTSRFLLPSLLLLSLPLRSFAQHEPPAPNPTHPLSSEYTLHPTFLTVSINGRLASLNRSSGDEIWSHATWAEYTSLSAPRWMRPVVGATLFPPPEVPEGGADGFGDDEEGGKRRQQELKETFIIEPQSGKVHIMIAGSHLQPFPYTIPELVEAYLESADSESSSSSPEKELLRPVEVGVKWRSSPLLFSGTKRTTLIVLELETGRVKAAYEDVCPRTLGAWGNQEDDGRRDVDRATEVSFVRVDYTVDVSSSSPHNPNTPNHIQTLAFTHLLPTDSDAHLQSLYSPYTLDDTYLQTLPNGGLVMFKVGREPPAVPLWRGGSVGGPTRGWEGDGVVIATFDVLVQTGSSFTFGGVPRATMLLQPPPPIPPTPGTANKVFVSSMKESALRFLEQGSKKARLRSWATAKSPSSKKPTSSATKNPASDGQADDAEQSGHKDENESESESNQSVSTPFGLGLVRYPLAGFTSGEEWGAVMAVEEDREGDGEDEDVKTEEVKAEEKAEEGGETVREPEVKEVKEEVKEVKDEALEQKTEAPSADVVVDVDEATVEDIPSDN